MARQCGEILANIHRMPIDSAEGLPDDDALEKYAGIYKMFGQPHPTFDLAIKWLRETRPETSRRTIVHGDFRNGNLIVGPDGLRAVLDWELAAPGRDPMEDLAWAAVRMWRFGNDHLEVGGFADRRALADGYRDGGGTFDADRFAWWKAARTLWWALGLASQAMGFASGAVPSIVMAASGRRVSEMEWDLLMLTRP